MGAFKFLDIFFKPFARPYFTTILLAFLIFTPMIHYANATMYGIQIDVFNDSKSAEERVNSLKQLGHDAFYRCETKESGEMTCRVFVDQFKTPAEAEEEAAFLKKLDLIKDFTIYAIVDKPPEEKPKPNPPPSPLKNPSGGYLIHAGSFQIKTNADNLVNRLEKAGYVASMKYEAIKGKGNFYRVYVSGYASRAAAENAAQTLKRSGIISSYAIKTMDEKPSSPPSKTIIDGGNGFYLHVGSYKDRNNAEKMVRTFQRQGYKAFFLVEELSSGTWFRLYIGGFNNENAARLTGAELKEKELTSYYKIIEIE